MKERKKERIKNFLSHEKVSFDKQYFSGSITFIRSIPFKELDHRGGKTSLKLNVKI